VDATVRLPLSFDLEVFICRFHVDRLEHVDQIRIGDLVSKHQPHQRPQQLAYGAHQHGGWLAGGVVRQIVRVWVWVHAREYSQEWELIPQVWEKNLFGMCLRSRFPGQGGGCWTRREIIHGEKTCSGRASIPSQSFMARQLDTPGARPWGLDRDILSLTVRLPRHKTLTLP